MAAIATWFYMNGQERIGPVSQDQLCDLFRKGVLGLQTLVWSDRFENWTPASSIAALRSLSPTTPNSLQLGMSPTGAASLGGRPITVDHDSMPAVDGPVGIGGWLILPAIGMIFSPILIALGVFALLLIARKVESSEVIGAAGHASSLRMLAGIHGLYLLYILYTAVAFFSTKRSAPALTIGAYLISAVLAVVALLMTRSIPQSPAAPPGKEWLDLAKPVAIALVWVPYFLVSRRVKNTFVN